MAHETVVETHEHDHEVNGAELWGGGVEPFKASYGKLMMWYFLLSDAFTFAGFLISYGALRFSMNTWPVPDFVFKTTPGGFENAPLIFVTFMTFVLIVSSVTVLRAVQEGKLENKNGVIKWLVITILGGGVFLGCQAWEWTNLISGEGMTVHVNPFSAHTEKGKYLSLDELKAVGAKNNWIEDKLVYVDEAGAQKEIPFFMDPKTGIKFYEKRDHHDHTPKDWNIDVKTPYLITYHHGVHDYLPAAYQAEDGKVKVEALGPKSFGTLFFFITGFHGFHVFSGLVFMGIVAIGAWNNVYGPRKNGYETVEKVGLYWHFVDLVWVFVFLVFYLI